MSTPLPTVQDKKGVVPMTAFRTRTLVSMLVLVVGAGAFASDLS
jgi:hypothetical protein